MPNLLPVHWKETMERIKDKANHYLKIISPTGENGNRRESIDDDRLPSFMQLGCPPLDMHETFDELVVSVEVPGSKKDDFQLELVGSRLVVRGEKKASRELKMSGGSYLNECSYGSFSRSVQLPCAVNENAIKAELKSGVLTVRMPKLETGKMRPHRLTVT